MYERITSVQNEYIKQLCRLNSAAGRKESGFFLIEGQKICAEAIQAQWPIERCLITERAKQSFDLSSLIVPVIEISEQVAKKLSSMDTPPGIFLVARQKAEPSVELPKFILALDHLSDPSNLGAILRSAEAFGAQAVFLSEGCVDLYSPKVIRAAMGSAFRVNVQKGDLNAFISTQKDRGYQILGAGLNRDFMTLQEVSFDVPTVLVIGNESNGITPEIMDRCDRGVFIPMQGENESLNAAVAASIILWEQAKWN